MSDLHWPETQTSVWRQVDTDDVSSTEAVQEPEVVASPSSEAGEEGPSPLTRYFRDAGRFPLLSVTEEERLRARLTRALTTLRKAQGMAEDTPLTIRSVIDGLDEASLTSLRMRRWLRIARACRQILIQSNLRLAVHIARRHNGQGVPLTDLVQDANIGLIKAVERFDPDRGFRFSTYAYWWISEETRRSLKKSIRVVRAPEHIVDDIRALQSTRHRLESRLDRKPTQNELAKALALSPQRVNELLGFSAAELSTESAVPNTKDLRVGDTLGAANDPAEALATRDRRRILDDILADLPERERDIISRRFGLRRARPETLQEISDHLNLSRERIRQIEKKGLERLRQKYDFTGHLAGN